jgi:hypothetical protein
MVRCSHCHHSCIAVPFFVTTHLKSCRDLFLLVCSYEYQVPTEKEVIVLYRVRVPQHERFVSCWKHFAITHFAAVKTVYRLAAFVVKDIHIYLAFLQWPLSRIYLTFSALITQADLWTGLQREHMWQQTC